jgi:hypothetical protein
MVRFFWFGILGLWLAATALGVKGWMEPPQYAGAPAVIPGTLALK